MSLTNNSSDFQIAMPTCWNGDLGIDGDHISHMAYTEDGYVAGAW